MRLATERLRLVAISLRVTDFHDGFVAPLAVVLGSRPTLAPEDLHRPGRVLERSSACSTRV